MIIIYNIICTFAAPREKRGTFMPNMSVSDDEFNARILEELDKLVELGVLDYVVPTDPIGEEWVVGHKLQILKFKTPEEITAFLAGVTVVSTFIAENHPHLLVGR